MSFKIAVNSKKSEKPGNSFLDSRAGILHISCKGCSRYADCTSPDCISCMCEAVAANGTADKIRLESGRDLELSGQAAEVICRLARIRRPIVQHPKSMKCSRCSRNPDSIVSFAWTSFPDPDIESARSRLYMERNDDSECGNCLMRTYNALTASLTEMDSIRKTLTDGTNCRRMV